MAEDSESFGQSDGLPHEFRPEAVISFFSEGLPIDVDLMMFEVDEMIFGGRLKTIVEGSRAMLPGLRGNDVHNLLLLGDGLLGAMVSGGESITDQHGEEHPLSQEVLNCLTPVDILPFVAGGYDRTDFVIRDLEGEGETQLELTAHRLCAAFALGQAFSAIRYGTHPECIAFGAYHALQAAEAFAMAKLLSGEETALALIAGKRRIEAQARQGAAARLANDSDGKQAAKVQALKLWQDWQAGVAIHKSGAAFARHVVSVTAVESTKTVEKWIAEWAAEARNRD